MIIKLNEKELNDLKKMLLKIESQAVEDWDFETVKSVKNIIKKTELSNNKK
jgi:hypothetical protein